MRARTAFLLFAALLIAHGASAQGHGYTPQDVENGGLIYQTSCAFCHGPEGDGVPGVNFASGTFRRATTDDELIKIIIGGIPGTAMPPSNYSEGQSTTIVAYLRSFATSPKTSMPAGNVSRGKSLFEGKGQCATCHSVGGVGSRTGPALTEVGAFRRTVELQRSILEPSAEIRTDNRSVRAVTRLGATVNGRLLNQDTFTLQLLDSNERLVLLDKSNLREVTVLKESPMPSYKGKLDAQELSDLVTYLSSLRGRQ